MLVDFKSDIKETVEFAAPERISAEKKKTPYHLVKRITKQEKPSFLKIILKIMSFGQMELDFPLLAIEKLRYAAFLLNCALFFSVTSSTSNLCYDSWSSRSLFFPR